MATYEIEVLSPLFVGSGQKYPPLEYLISLEEEKFVVADMERVFTSPRFVLNDFLDKVKRPGFFLGESYPWAREFPRFKFSSSRKTLMDLKIRKAEVLAPVAEGQGFYLPGSSLKGSLRTLIYKINLPEIKETFNQKIKERLQNPRIKKEKLSEAAEMALTGTPNYSLFRALKVGDSLPLGEESLGLYQVKVLSLTTSGYRWKVLPGEQSTADLEQATSSFFIGFKPGVKLQGSFKVEEKYLNDDNFPLVNKAFFNNWQERAKEVQRQFLQNELKFYEEIGLEELKKFYQKLIQDSNDGIILQLGWGTGFNSKTLKEALPEEELKEVINWAKIKYRENFPFPKTRKIVVEKGKPLYPTGWIKLRILD
ncbi:type III-A CRISPR-associated RAMP protein Csm5 [Carboxydothermus hydrogenoformans]|uniref:CRISPR system Cms protein Csm5 n=1 Tax=Carboxydothermus hydrogenoformans (strain ATCC BAA-161 / DSM 6008 / Z-2901) TaxID=246194 RepID=Q3AA80_CARHZ|nr:type III-A CRISPR-associated RAMP protein Csm5 [Carboxydothermus hydrogenoformans]ABB14520.1 CRISPR-associated RAMP protein, Csm5 family [Carboxydothermus hydrogenoformans Z-2901]